MTGCCLAFSFIVIAGLDPAIQGAADELDCRVKPGNDSF